MGHGNGKTATGWYVFKKPLIDNQPERRKSLPERRRNDLVDCFSKGASWWLFLKLPCVDLVVFHPVLLGVAFSQGCHRSLQSRSQKDEANKTWMSRDGFVKINGDRINGL